MSRSCQSVSSIGEQCVLKAGHAGPHALPSLLESEHKTLPPERDLAAEFDALGADHAAFASTVGPLLSDLSALVRQHDTTIKRLQSELAALKMRTPVGIVN